MFFILWLIVVGLIAGWAAGKIMGTGGYGPAMDILLGIAGAFVGGFLLRLVGLRSGAELETRTLQSELVNTLGQVVGGRVNADIVDGDSLVKVRMYKQQLKAAAKAE